MAKWIKCKSKKYGGDENNRKMEESYEENYEESPLAKKIIRTTGKVLTIIGLILIVGSIWISIKLLIPGAILSVIGLGMIWSTENIY